MIRIEPDDAGAQALARLHDVAMAGLGGGWPAQDLCDFARAPGGALLVDDAAAPGGFALIRVALDEAELLALAVAPGARRCGLGRALLAAALCESERLGAASLMLEVSAENAPARALYDRAGFTEIGRRRGYYFVNNRRVDALLLRADVKARR